jgi:hypothetical protein
VIDAQEIDAQWVATAARLQDLTIPPAYLPEVIANLQRTAQIAASVCAVDLDSVQDESAPIWIP